MYPSVEEALNELKIAEKLNPGPWIKHSKNVGLAARNIAHCIPGMNEEKAYVVGLLHDIGRRVGIVNIPKHVYEGYKYCMKKNWDEPARVCMTHSYVFMKDEFNFKPNTLEEFEIKNNLIKYDTADDYDRLIQMCDSLATDYGFVILEKRFVDVTRRYGIMEDYIKGWDVVFKIKEDFENRMGCSIYDVLPNIGITTLLSPKPWTPPAEKKPAIKLETERLILRNYSLEDFDALYEIMSDPETMQHYPSPFDEERIKGWITWNLENYKKYGFGLWAVVLKETGEFIGDCGITIQNIDGQMLPEIGYHINKKHWRKGYAKEAARAVRDWVFTYTDYKEIYSYMKYTNIGSYSTALANGMKKVKEYPDPKNIISYAYSITKEEWEKL